MSQTQQTWGFGNKSNLYGRNKESDDESDTSDDQDELQQAEMLQKIKADKMKRWMQERVAEQTAGTKQDDEKSEEEQSHKDQASESSDEEYESDEEMNIGDKLFGKKIEAKKAKVDLDAIQQELSQTDEAIELLDPTTKLSPTLAKIVKSKRDLLQSYKTYLTYYLYEQWHLSQGQVVSP